MQNARNQCLHENDILNQRYTIKQVLSISNHAIVYLALDATLGIEVVIKEYFPKELCTRDKEIMILNIKEFQEGKDHFLLETRILMKLEQEEIVRCYNYFEENYTAYRVMEYVEGQTLKEYLKEHGKVSIHKTKIIAGKIMDALIKIHSLGYVHLDITPENIMICKNDIIKLMGFSNIAQLNSKNINKKHKTQYQPSEQYHKKYVVHPNSDVYSLGATIYHMLTGTIPCNVDKRKYLTEKYHHDILEKLSYFDQAIPEEMEHAVMKSLSIEQAKRFQTIQEFKDIFMGYKKLEPSLEQKQFLDRTKKIAYSLIAIGCVLIIGLLGYIYHQKNSGIQAMKVAPDTITVMLPYQDETDRQYNEEIINAYKSNYQQIDIQVIQVQKDEYSAVLYNSDTLPDVFFNDGSIEEKYLASLRPLLESMDETQYYIVENKKDFIYQIPLAFEAKLYYVNRKQEASISLVNEEVRKHKDTTLEQFLTHQSPYYYGTSSELINISNQMKGYWDVLEDTTIEIVLQDMISIKKSNENREKAAMLYIYELLCDLAQNNHYIQTTSYIPINKDTAKVYYQSYPQLSFISKAKLEVVEE